MTPLLLLGAVLMLGLAASKAKAETPPAPTPKPEAKAPKPKVTIKTPSKKKRARRRKVIKKVEAQKRVKQIQAVAKSARARQAVNQLVKIAQNKALPKTTRAAALKKVEAIVAKPVTLAASDPKNLPKPAKAALAAAVAKAQKETKPTPDQAAKILQIWTKGGGNQGTKNNRSATVKRCQELMGFSGSDADGIIGPATRARAKALGYVLAPRSAQKPGAVGYSKVLQFHV